VLLDKKSCFVIDFLLPVRSRTRTIVKKLPWAILGRSVTAGVAFWSRIRRVLNHIFLRHCHKPPVTWYEV